MHPVLFEIFGKPIYGFGVMAALGFLASLATWHVLGRREHRPPGFAADLGFWLMAAGLVGSRLAYVFANWSYYRTAPLEIIRIDEGGLIFYGGLVLGSVALVLFARHHRQSIWNAADFAIPGLAIGHALGRLGCFLNGCCYGRPAAWPALGIAYPAGCEPAQRFPGVPLYPVQLLESAALFLIWLILLRAYPRRRKDGTVFALYLILYPACRFLLEFLRGDERQGWQELNVAQAISLAMILAGILLFALLPRRTSILRP